MTNFNYNEFKNGKVATTKLGKAIRFVCELQDGNMMVSEERYRGMGFDCGQPVTYRYKKDGTSLHGPTPWNRLEFAA